MSSWITLKFRAVLHVLRATNFQSSYVGLQKNRPIVSAATPQTVHCLHPNLQFYSTNTNNTSTNAKGYTPKPLSSINPNLTVQNYILKFPHYLFTCRIKDEKIQPEPAAPAHASKTFSFSYWYVNIITFISTFY